MIKAVLFDLDDTLLNQKAASLAALKAFHRTHCATMEWAEVHARWNHSIRTHFERYVRGEITYQEQRRCRIRDLFDEQTLSDEAADGLFSVYLSEYEGNYALFPEVRRVLDSLAGFPMAVISNGETRQQHDKLVRTGIHGRFQAVLISEEVGIRKPDAGIFLLAAGKLGVHPGECLFIGDNPEADYQGSQGAGMIPVLMARDGNKAPGQVRKISTFEEIPGLIRSLSDEGNRVLL